MSSEFRYTMWNPNNNLNRYESALRDIDTAIKAAEMAQEKERQKRGSFSADALYRIPPFPRRFSQLIKW